MAKSVDPRIQQVLEQLFGKEQETAELSRDEVEAILHATFETKSAEMDAIYLKNLLSNSPDKIYFKDLESKFIKVNETCANFFGFSDPEGLVGKSDFDFFPYKSAIQRFADEQKIIQNKEPVFNKDEKEDIYGGKDGWSTTSKLPLYSLDGEVVGSFGISKDITEKKQAEEKLRKLAEQLQLKNEQIEMDLEMARKVQMAFLPKNYPSFTWDMSSNESALKFYHRYLPSETLAGDFFQVIPISNSQAGVIICDVMGHGVRASLVTAVLKGLVGELKLITPYPHVFLRKVNRSLNALLAQLDVTMFVTAFYGVFDLIKGQFRYANAGHPEPILINKYEHTAEYVEAVSDDPEPALGLIDNFKYTSRIKQITPGESVIFFTDGILEVETEDGKQFGKDRMLDAARLEEYDSSETVLENLFKNVEEFTGGKGYQDDMCAVSVDIMRVADQGERP